jgi:hypothetical protein
MYLIYILFSQSCADTSAIPSRASRTVHLTQNDYPLPAYRAQSCRQTQSDAFLFRANVVLCQVSADLILLAFQLAYGLFQHRLFVIQRIPIKIIDFHPLWVSFVLFQ